MKTKFRIPISFKLIFLTIFLLAITTVIIAVQSASRFEEISADREEQASRDQTRALASEVDGLMLTFVDKAKVVGSLLMKDTGTPEEREKTLDFAFYRDRDLVAIEVITKTPNAEPMRVVNEKNLKADEPGLDKSFIDVLRQAQKARGLVKFETSASVSELKKNPMGTVAAGDGFPVAILNRNEPAFYCIPAKAYEALIEKLEDAELNAIADARANQAEIKVKLKDL